jgi:hypothetical protein
LIKQERIQQRFMNLDAAGVCPILSVEEGLLRIQLDSSSAKASFRLKDSGVKPGYYRFAS